MYQTLLRFGFGALVLLTAYLPASAAVTIDPPAGWKPGDISSTSALTYEGAWTSPAATDGFSQIITLLKQTVAGMTLDDYVDLNIKQLRGMDQNLTFAVNSREPCGSGSMQHLKYTTVFGSRNVTIEQLLVPDAGSFYVGTYVRLVSQPDLAEASAALKTMCSHLTAGAG